MHALILSAGLGERLRPTTLKTAKPAIDFLTIPMLGFPYYWLSTLGLSDLTFNTHHLPDTIRHAAMHAVDPEIHMHFPHEAHILGSGGGIWNSAVHLKPSKNFAVANGDGVIVSHNENLLREMLEEHESENALATILVCPLEGVGEKIPGVWANAENHVFTFGKGPKEPHLKCYHYASVMIFSERIWPHMPNGSSNILYDVLVERIAAGEKVLAYVAEDLKWFETGNAQDFLSATKECLKHLVAKDPVGIALERILGKSHANYRLHADDKSLRMIAHSADVPANMNVNGFLVVGEGASVAPGTRLQNCVILRDSKVPAGEFSGQIL